MNVKKAAPLRSLKSDLARVDAHVASKGEYEELPELTDDMLARAVVNKGGRPVSENPREHRSTRLPADVMENQWIRTVSLAEDWLKRHAESIGELPHYSDRWREDLDGYLCRHFKAKDALRTSRLVHILEIVRNSASWTIGELWQLGQIARNTRQFMEGDLVLLMLTNGVDRHPIWTYSSRRRNIAGVYVDTDRLGYSGTVHHLEWPDELVGLQPTDPAVRQYVMGLRTGSAAIRIGAGSPEPTCPL